MEKKTFVIPLKEPLTQDQIWKAVVKMRSLGLQGPYSIETDNPLPENVVSYASKFGVRVEHDAK